jgi:hypothetical protein
MEMPKVKFAGTEISRLICGGNPVSGFSHFSDELDEEFRKYYTFENCHRLIADCEKNGINTMQFRGDRFYLRLILEHRGRGGKMNFIMQTASEMRDIKANIKEIKSYGPLAIYHHGTHTDNMYHEGRIDEIGDIIKAIKDTGAYAGLGTHIPGIIEYAEEKGWPTDFYMACLYNLARKTKAVQALGQKSSDEVFIHEDRDEMAAVVRKVKKPCLAFKVLAASRNCGTDDCVKEAFKYAFDRIKPTDAVVVGMFQKYKNQVKENSDIVKQIG